MLDPLSHRSSSLGTNYLDNKIFNDASPIIREISNIIIKVTNQFFFGLLFLLLVILEVNRKNVQIKTRYIFS